MKIACLQLNSNQVVADNIAIIKKLSLQAVQRDGAEAIVLPENAFCHPYDRRYQAELDRVLPQLAQFAHENGVWIFAGTIPVSANDGTQKVFSRLHVINSEGQLVTTYNKMHLFDVHVKEEKSDYCESDAFVAGREVVVATTPWGKIGLAICYDLRFPELFRAMEAQQPFALVTPSAFTFNTGQKHWQHLLSARAVDNFAWVLAAGQCGTHPGGRRTFGHSAIVNPNGDVTAQIKDDVGYICAEIDDTLTRELRSHIPLAQHRKL